MGYDWEEWRDTLDEMLLDPDFEYADETLSGIQKWIVENEHITAGQIMAITNIQEGTQR